jgi:hypothetical protein
VLAFFVISFGKFDGRRLEGNCYVRVCPAAADTTPFVDCFTQLQFPQIFSLHQMNLSAWELRLASTNHTGSIFLSRNLPGIEPFSDPKLAKLNRQTQELELVVTYRKQRAADSSNRQNIQKCPLDIPSISQVAE